MGTVAFDKYSFYTLQHDFTPPGTYTLIPHIVQNGPLKGLKTYCLINPELGVFEEQSGYTGAYPMRYAILIHPGNWAHDSIGCILPGIARDTLYPKPNVGGSQVAFRQIMGFLGGVAGHTLEIRDVQTAA
ncbi:MAG: hypothetical protein KGH65_03635 [Candidatus Micrarchaeota archaeon]|nr:hypothetical protein [Candidatus Micrarchaeota archaeon]